jgi:glycosyltransferase involved in cell wall biosynthesis
MAERETSVTVIIPVWDDYVRFLPDAVASVTRDAPEAAILVVDNASTTHVPESDGVSLIRAPRRLSVGAARNLGLEHVETEFVLALDADDLLLPGTLGFLEDRLRSDPTISVCATSIVDGTTGQRHRVPRRFVTVFSRFRRTFAFADAIWSLYPIQSCAMMHTSQARDAGGYADANWGDDWVLAVSLAFRGRVEVSRRLGRYYRATTGSLWRRPRPPRDLVTSARLVRERIRSDVGIPAWARTVLPVVYLLQLGAIYLVRPPYLVLRKVQGRIAR